MASSVMATPLPGGEADFLAPFTAGQDIGDEDVDWYKVSALVLEPATPQDLWQKIVESYGRSFSVPDVSPFGKFP